MKSLLTVLSIMLCVNFGFAQLTITNADMPSVGDTFRVSNGLITAAIDPVPTGSQFTWDFSMLQMVTQDVDTFVNVSSTGGIYSIVFSNLPFNPYRANLAARGSALPAIPQLTISDVVYFYYNSSGGYEVSGYGANINGVSAPIPFNNKDKIYDFPLNFGNTDSSDSDFQLNVPGLGFYGHNQHRVNEVDGWGTLITPFGSFNTLRIKSQITSVDSLYIDSVGTGFGFSLPPTTEYKWLGAQSGIPLLQITTTNTLGTEIISSIRYRDSLRVLTGIEALDAQSNLQPFLYPNPSNGIFTLETTITTGNPTAITLYSINGEKIKELWSGNLRVGKNSLNFDIKDTPLANGIYLLKIESDGSEQVRLLMLNK